MINTKGLMLATAAAALFASGASLAVEHEKKAGTEAKVHCGGVNACKGQSECKTATNSCKGENKCAGQGWLSMTKADCEAKGGKVVK